jgi:hypothetical protein
MKHLNIKIILILFIIHSIGCKKDNNSNISNEIDSIDVFMKRGSRLSLQTTFKRGERVGFNYISNDNNETYTGDLLILEAFEQLDKCLNYKFEFKNSYLSSYSQKRFSRLYTNGTLNESNTINRNITNYITSFQKYVTLYDTVDAVPKQFSCNSILNTTYNTSNNINSLSSNINTITQCIDKIELYPVLLFGGYEFLYNNTNLKLNKGELKDISNLIYTMIFIDIFSVVELIEFQRLIFNKNLNINPPLNVLPNLISSDVIYDYFNGLYSREIKLNYVINNNRIDEIEAEYINITSSSKKTIVYKINYK